MDEPIRVLLDADVIIRLHEKGGSTLMTTLLAAARGRISTTAVIEKQAAYYRENGRGRKIPIKLQGYIDNGLLTLESVPATCPLFVELLAGTAFGRAETAVLHRGELGLLAVACEKGYVIATDEQATREFVTQKLGRSRVITTRGLLRKLLPKPKRRRR